MLQNFPKIPLNVQVILQNVHKILRKIQSFRHKKMSHYEILFTIWYGLNFKMG